MAPPLIYPYISQRLVFMDTRLLLPWKKKKVAHTFKLRYLKKGQTNQSSMKSASFLGHSFSCKHNRLLYFKFYIKKAVLPIYRMITRMLDLLWQIVRFYDTPISRFLWALYRLDRQLQYWKRLSMVWLDTYGLYLFPWEIWRWVVHFDSEKGTSTDKSLISKPMSFQNSKLFCPH
jgi:hypothetical protein